MNKVLLGNCLEQMRGLPDNSVDSIVTDPPYGLSFMGKKWDYDVPSEEIWREALRVLKPGGHLLAFSGTRTYHRMVVRIEDAGFEIRDQIQWIYGSGFPKSHNLKGEHQGIGTALKPANEPICLARKPLEGTVAQNVLKHGCGAINIDGSRIGTNAGWSYPNGRGGKGCFGRESLEKNLSVDISASQGRWPANVIFDEEAAAVLDEQSGQSKSVNRPSNADSETGNGKTHGKMKGIYTERGFVDSGGASRFFYVAKASKRERNAGLEGLPEKLNDFQRSSSGLASTTIDGVRQKGGCGQPNANHHPTVKPIKLMEYLCKLITPPGGTVLDPFMGSGSTGVAATKLGFQFIGCELSAEYMEIAQKRIANAKGEENE